MDKINWINGQAGGTPLSAENLNLMQDNIEDAIDEVADDLSNAITYSTEEKVVGKWIDGKTIYRKVVDLGRFGSTDSEVTVSGSYDTVVNFYGYIYTSSAKLSLSQYSSSSTWREIFFEVIDGVLKIHLSRDASGQGHWSNFNVKVVIEYTKTTD